MIAFLINHKTLCLIFIIYIFVISLISIIFTMYDKLAAKHHRYRVPEATLMALSALGGSVAMYITMRLIRHKTLHYKFMFGIPAIIVVQVAIIILIVCKLNGVF